MGQSRSPPPQGENGCFRGALRNAVLNSFSVILPEGLGSVMTTHSSVLPHSGYPQEGAPRTTGRTGQHHCDAQASPWQPRGSAEWSGSHPRTARVRGRPGLEKPRWPKACVFPT